MESRYLHHSHNISVLMYHVVGATECRRVMSEHVNEVLREMCLEIEERCEVWIPEIGYTGITRTS